MFESTSVFLFFFLSLLHCLKCNERDDGLQIWMSILPAKLGSCSQYFQYKRIDDFINGNLTLPNMKKGDKVKLTFKTHDRFTLPNNGILLPDGSSEELVNRVQNGQPISYRVDFPHDMRVPKLNKIFINAIELCTTKFDFEDEREEIILQHTLYIINDYLSVFTHNVNIPNFIEAPSCGIANTKVTINGVSPLIYGLTEMSHGGHPWPSAIHERQASLMANAMCSRKHNDSSTCEAQSGDVLTRNSNGCWMPESVIAAGLIFQRCSNPLQLDTMYCDIARHISRLENYIAHQEQQVVGSLEEICGKSGTQSRRKHPWLVAVYQKMWTGVIYTCSGILISSRSVLAMADCFLYGFKDKMEPHNFRIYLGRYDLRSLKENGVVSRDIANIIFHPDFQNNNLALLHMKSAVSFTQYVTPICLRTEPTDEQSQFKVQTFTSISWNHDEVRMNNLTMLQLEEVNYASVRECNVGERSLKYLCIPRLGLELQMLIVQENQRWLLRGLLFGWRGDSELYTNITDFRSWILHNML